MNYNLRLATFSYRLAMLLVCHDVLIISLCVKCLHEVNKVFLSNEHNYYIYTNVFMKEKDNTFRKKDSHEQCQISLSSMIQQYKMYNYLLYQSFKGRVHFPGHLKKKHPIKV